MRPAQFTYDSLWHCLCPAFDRIALGRAVHAPVLSSSTAPTARHATRHGWPRNHGVAQRRGYKTLDHKSLADLEAREARRQFLRMPTPEGQPNPLNRSLDETLLAPTPPEEKVLEVVSIEELQKALMKIRAPEGYSVHGQPFDRHERIIQIVKHLIQKREMPADTFIYESMMDAMIAPQGSAKGVRALLKEMEEEKISLSETICRSALAALAVHPDYALRQQVLEVMQERWFTLGLPDTQNYALGLLRDGQYELAYDNFMDLVEQGKHVDFWLFDVFIAAFGHQGFLDEALQLLIRRKHAQGSGLQALNSMYYVLDVCSAGSHYQGTIFTWNALVRNGSVQPSDGILENVLATAAREGDSELASEVQSMISSRSKVQIHHYDAVVEAFAKGNDVAGALRVLCIMGQNGLPVLRENTRSIYQAIIRNKAMIEDAESAIRHMAETKPVPLGAVAVVLEAMAKRKGTGAAIPLYKDTLRLSEQEPDASMIQDMIINSNNFDHTREYLRQYKEKIPPHEKPPSRVPMAYNKLIPLCLDFNELGLAFRFANSAVSDQSSSHRVPLWLMKLTETAIKAEDARVWKLYDVFQKSGNKDAMESIKRISKLMRRQRQDRAEKGKVKAKVSDESKPDDAVDDLVREQR